MSEAVDKLDCEVAEQVYRMRPNGTMSTANTVPYSDTIEHHKARACVEFVNTCDAGRHL